MLTGSQTKQEYSIYPLQSEKSRNLYLIVAKL